MKIEVANGEIVDKLTILKIKLENSDSPEKTEHILKELEYLRPIVESLDVPQEMIDELQKVNQRIWNTEDSIRLCEKNKQLFNLPEMCTIIMMKGFTLSPKLTSIPIVK